MLEIVAFVALNFTAGFAVGVVAPLFDVSPSDIGVFIRGALFRNGVLVIFIVLVIPPIEEAMKFLGVAVFGRARITTECEALLIGLMAGAGFAIAENLMYQTLILVSSGAAWFWVPVLRVGASLLHPLSTALVAVGWFRARHAGRAPVVKGYVAAVGLHMLWNGGAGALIALDAVADLARTSAALRLSIGLGVLGAAAYLLVLAAVLVWLFRRVVHTFAAQPHPYLLNGADTRRTDAFFR